MWGFEFDKADIFVNAPFLNTIFFFFYLETKMFLRLFLKTDFQNCIFGVYFSFIVKHWLMFWVHVSIDRLRAPTVFPRK